MVSKCPLDPRHLKMTAMNQLFKFTRMTELPWAPLYNQRQNNEEQSESSWMYTYAMAGTILFTVLVFLLERILDERQAQAYQKTEFPADLSLTVSKIDSEKAKDEKKNDSSVNDTKDKDISNSNPHQESSKNIDTHKPILPQLKDKFLKAQAYGMDKIQFGMLSSSFHLIESISLLMFGFLPYCWDLSLRLGNRFFFWNESNHEIRITLIFLFITTLVSTVTDLPFELV
jgi:hypothetical protein